MRLALVSLLILFASNSHARAQLTGAKEGPIAMGHHHFFVTDVDAHMKLWTELLGAEPVKLAEYNVLKLPNLIIFITENRPAGGTKGTIVNHVGLQVRELRPLVARLKAAVADVATKREVPPAEDDVFYFEDTDSYLAFVMAPDDTKVELIEKRSLDAPIANHHIHFYTPEVDEMRDWYVRLFGATPGKRGGWEAADLPGVNLTFTATKEPVVGIQGRVLNHIGFEVQDLESFCKKLEGMGVKFDRPYREIPELGVGLAFLTDPWGTCIELTEGLDEL